MDKYSNYYRIDMSKDVFDVMKDKGNHKQYPDNPVGFKQFEKQLQSSSCCVMEVTGVYHTSLANHLYKSGVFVSEVNPPVIKRYILMNLRRIKTNKADAEMICKYAMQNELKVYHPESEYIRQSRISKQGNGTCHKGRNYRFQQFKTDHCKTCPVRPKCTKSVQNGK